MENPAGRYGFRSSEVLRAADGGFVDLRLRAAHAGNWLPIGADSRFALVLRLYDSPLGATRRRHRQDAMPRSSGKAARESSPAASAHVLGVACGAAMIAALVHIVAS